MEFNARSRLVAFGQLSFLIYVRQIVIIQQNELLKLDRNFCVEFVECLLFNLLLNKANLLYFLIYLTVIYTHWQYIQMHHQMYLNLITFLISNNLNHRNSIRNIFFTYFHFSFCFFVCHQHFGFNLHQVLWSVLNLNIEFLFNSIILSRQISLLSPAQT